MQGESATVAALVGNDPRGLEEVYRTYADRLYAFCRGMIQRPGEAADAVHDTFVLASQYADRLREPELLRCWLYALARAGCLRVLRGRPRRLPVVEPDHVTGPDPRTGMGAAQVQELVWSAGEGLDLTDWDIFELADRHELSTAEVARVLDLPAAEVRTRLAQVRNDLTVALVALLAARTGRGACPRLAGILRGWDEWRLAPRTRRRVSGHIESCETCRRHADDRQLISPSSLLTAYASAPFPAVPAELWPRLEATSLAPSFGPSREAIRARGPRLDPATGFPYWPDPQRRLSRLAGLAAAAVVAVLAVVAGTVLTSEGVPNAPPNAAPLPPDAPVSPERPSAPPPSAAPESPAGPAESPDEPVEPLLSPPAGALDPEPPAQDPAEIPSPEPPPASPAAAGVLTVEASARATCAPDGSHQLSATLTANRPLAAATLWVKSGGPAQTFPMTVDGSTASGVSGSMTGNNVRWQVLVTDQDGREAETSRVKIGRVCRD